MTGQWHEGATTSGLCLVPPIVVGTPRHQMAPTAIEPTLGHSTYGEVRGPTINWQ